MKKLCLTIVNTEDILQADENADEKIKAALAQIDGVHLQCFFSPFPNELYPIFEVLCCMLPEKEDYSVEIHAVMEKFPSAQVAIMDVESVASDLVF